MNSLSRAESACDARTDIVSGVTWRNGSGQKAGDVVHAWDKLNRPPPGVMAGVSLLVAWVCGFVSVAGAYSYDRSHRESCSGLRRWSTLSFLATIVITIRMLLTPLFS
jgi:hypothetical protein